MNEFCDVCGLPFREDDRRSLYGTRHELTFKCIGRLRWELEKLRAMLKTIEWPLDTNQVPYCPWCGRNKSEGHKSDCELVIALGAQP